MLKWWCCLQETVVVDAVLVAAGRSPNVTGLALEAAGVLYDPTDGVKVLPACLPACLSICLSLSVCLSVRLSLSVCLSVCPSQRNATHTFLPQFQVACAWQAAPWQQFACVRHAQCLMNPGTEMWHVQTCILHTAYVQDCVNVLGLQRIKRLLQQQSIAGRTAAVPRMASLK